MQVTIECKKGIRPVKVLGRSAEIIGQKVVCSINQLYSDQEKYLMLEVEIPAGMADSVRDVANVKVSYANMETKTNDRLTSAVAVRFTKSKEQVAQKRDKQVLEAAVMQVATARNILATELRDEGKQEEAKKLLLSNGIYLREQGDDLDSQELITYGLDNYKDADNLAPGLWKGQRKSMRGLQFKNKKQQSYWELSVIYV